MPAHPAHDAPALMIYEALDIIRDAVADLEAARASDAAIIGVLRAEVAALRDDRDMALARLDRANDAIRTLEAAPR